MALLSYANWVTLYKAGIKYLEYIENAAASTSPSQVTNYDAITTANLGECADQIANGLRAHRTGSSGLLSPGAVLSVMGPILAEGALAVGAPESKQTLLGNPSLSLYRIREYAVANSKSLNAREFTLGSVTAGGSNVGTGTVYRLNVDHDDFALEGGHAEVKTFTCRQDQIQVDVGEEVFEVAGETPKSDFLVVAGSGSQGFVSAVTTKTSERYLANPTFSQFSGTAPTAGVPTVAATTDAFAGWVLTTAANARATIDYAFRDRVGVTQTYGCEFTDNNTLTQTFSAQRRPVFDLRTPYFVRIAVYRRSTSTGNIVLTFGGSSLTTSLAGLTDNAWNKIVLTLDKRVYHKNFSTNAPTFSVAYNTAGGSKLVTIDDIIISPMTFIDGRWWIIDGGATPFKRDDTFTFTDTVNATRGKCSYWTHHRSGLALSSANPQWGNGFCFPVNAAGAETVTDP